MRHPEQEEELLSQYIEKHISDRESHYKKALSDMPHDPEEFHKVQLPKVDPEDERRLARRGVSRDGPPLEEAE